MYDYDYDVDYDYDYSYDYDDYDYGDGYTTVGDSEPYGYVTNNYSLGTISIISLVISCVFLLFIIISTWKLFKKAGKPGWASIVPIYNLVVLIQIAGLPLWYLVLMIIPIANIYALFKICIEIAHKFGKGTGFGVLSVLFPFICVPVLAFGKSTYNNGNTNQVVNPNDGVNANQFQNMVNSNENVNNLNNVDVMNNVNPSMGVVSANEVNNINGEVNNGSQNVNIPVDNNVPVVPMNNVVSEVTNASDNSVINNNVAVDDLSGNNNISVEPVVSNVINEPLIENNIPTNEVNTAPNLVQEGVNTVGTVSTDNVVNIVDNNPVNETTIPVPTEDVIVPTGDNNLNTKKVVPEVPVVEEVNPDIVEPSIPSITPEVNNVLDGKNDTNQETLVNNIEVPTVSGDVSINNINPEVKEETPVEVEVPSIEVIPDIVQEENVNLKNNDNDDKVDSSTMSLNELISELSDK